jgi:FkbM family methyltransferase
MKTLVKFVLQKALGFKNYLFVFSLYITATLKRNRKEGDFLHFLSMLPEDSTILDIGANIGVMTLQIARKLPGAIVYSFEPVPDNLYNIRRLIKFYKIENVKVFEIALGNSNGTAEIIMPEYNHVKFHGLSHVEGVEGTEGDSGIKYSVPIRKLDDLDEMQTLSKPVSGIKIDVENYEYNVLDGARKLLIKYKPIIYAELWENQNRTDCIKLLNEIGYTAYILYNGVLVKFDPQKHQTQNFFFQILPQS